MRLLLLSACAVFAAGQVTHAQTRVVLYETFTSSTCPPCNPGNATFESVLNGKPTTEYVSVKYQQNFPGTGDPYTTTEGVTRRSTYYAINSVPRLRIDGGYDSNSNYFNNTRYMQAKAVAATYDVSGNYSVANKVVTAKVRWKPLVAYTGEKLHVAIVETFTDSNVKSNGETKFFNVMKKMMPSEAGTVIAEKPVGTWDSTTLTFTFAGNYRKPLDGLVASRINHTIEHSVENFANLKVVAWIQGTDKKVYQAANLTKNTTGIEEASQTVATLEVYPNPAADQISLSFDMKAADEIFAQLVSMNGSVVRAQRQKLGAGKQSMTIDTRDLAAGNYTLVATDSKHNVFAQIVSVMK